MKNWGVFLTTVILAAFLGFMAIQPPAAVPADSDPNGFSSGRAMVDVRAIAAKPHPTGSAENAKVRQLIMERLSGLGLEVAEHESNMTGYGLKRLNRWSDGNKTEQPIFNITGIMKGADPEKPALLLMAHHDTVWDSPGASDDTVGIAVILEILRAIKDDKDRGRDVIVLITDAEELGLVGAINFFKNNPLKDKVGAIINFEARGAAGTANLFQLNSGNGEAARLFARNVREPSASSLAAYIYNVLPNDTDLTPALKEDYIAYNIAMIGKAGMYHSPLITPDELAENSVQHMGVQGLDLTRALIKADELPGISADATFFDAFGFFVVRYAPIWGWGLLGVGLLGFLTSVRGRFDVSELRQGFRQMSAFILFGGLALYGLNWLSGHGKTYEGVNKGVGYYDRLAAIPRLEVIALLFCLAALLFVFGKSEKSPSQYLGVAIPVLFLAVIGQVMAPTATYFLSIPVAFAGIAAFAKSKMPENTGSTVTAVLAIPVVGYMIGLAHLVLLGVGADMLSAAIIPAALAALMLAPIFPEVESTLRRRVPFILFLAAIGIACWIRFDQIAVTVPTYRVW